MPVDPYTYVETSSSSDAPAPVTGGNGGSPPTSVHHAVYHVEWRRGEHAWRVQVGDKGELQLQRSNAAAPNEWSTRAQHY